MKKTIPENHKKPNKILLGFFLLMLTSCTNNHSLWQLAIDDYFNYIGPDSTEKALREDFLEKRDTTREHKMYYAIKYIKGRKASGQKSHLSKSQTDSIVRYYEHSTDRQCLPEALECAGHASIENGDTAGALDYYQKACGEYYRQIQIKDNIDNGFRDFINIISLISAAIIITLILSIAVIKHRQRQLRTAYKLFLLKKIGENTDSAKKNDGRGIVQVKLLASEAYKILTRHIQSGKNIKAEEWSLIDSTINECIPAFKLSLFSSYKLSKLEYQICMLVKFGLSVKEMATILNKSDSAISLARKRLYKKLTGKDGSAKDLDDFVNAI